jgi:hypothetical protein
VADLRWRVDRRRGLGKRDTVPPGATALGVAAKLKRHSAFSPPLVT